MGYTGGSKFAIIMLLLLAGMGLRAQPVTDTTAIARIMDRVAGRLLRAPEIRSLSVGVLAGDKRLTRHYGELTSGRGNPPNDTTVYEIASVTKTMIGYLVAATVEAGRLSADDDVRDYLPGEFPNLAVDGEPVRIRHLLTHTSGLPGFLPLAYLGIFETFAADVPERFLAAEREYGKEVFWEDLATVRLTDPPGTTYAYSSAGTELLAYILEGVNGLPLAEQVVLLLTGPQQMEHTNLRLSGTVDAVRGYWMDNDRPSPGSYNALWGGGVGITATLPDLLRFGAL